MQITTKVFGEITIDDEKIINFPSGIIGFPELTDFALIHDEEKGTDTIYWLQSLQEPAFAMPVMDPLIVCPDYNPEVDDELLNSIGEIVPEELLVMVTVTIPKDIKNMTVNLKGPMVINAAQRKATQVIVEGDEYQVKFPIYEILNKKKEKAGEYMLALSRKKNEALVINNNVEITVLEIKGEQVKLGITAPREVPVYRKEVYIQIQDANKEAVDVDGMEALRNLLG